MWAFLRRLVCSHNYSIAADSGVMFLRCVECGHQTSGWSLNAAQGVGSPSPPVVTVRCRVLPGPHSELTGAWLTERHAIQSAEPVEVVVPPAPEPPSEAAIATAKTAVIYICAGASGKDLDNELDELRRYVSSRGWQAVEHIEQHSVDAKDRPALQHVLEEARHQQIELLVCWRLDRLARRATQLLLLLDELTSLGVAVVSVGDDIDTVVPGGKVQLPLVSALASLERRRRANLVVAAQNGRQRRAKRRHGFAEGAVTSIHNLSFGDPGRFHAVPSVGAHSSDLSESGHHARREDSDLEDGPIRTPLESDGRSEQGYRARAT